MAYDRYEQENTEFAPLLYEQENIDTSLGYLIWCKDVYDMVAIGKNSVCFSTLARFKDLDRYENFIKQFKFILVAIPDNDLEYREKLSDELAARFEIPILVPRDGVFRGGKSIVEVWDDGEKATKELLFGAKEVSIGGLINVADIDCAKRKNAKRVLSGIKLLDHELGGFVGGEVTVWTGRRGEGKSTLVGQILLDAVNQGHSVCAYSGELPKEQFKLGMLQQAAGYNHTKRRDDPQSGRTFFDVPDDVVQAIDKWWNRKLFLTDIQYKNAHEEDNIFKVFEYANRMYNCDMFLVDNIMTAELKYESAEGYFRAQSAFVGRLVAFAKRLDVHVHLVAHPKKVDKKSGLDADDVGGSGDITNRVDNVIKIERVLEEKIPETGASTVLTILKNREFGARGKILLEYNEPSRRLYQSGGSASKIYGWERKCI